MNNAIIKFFNDAGAILQYIKTEKKLNSIIYYYKYINYTSINKLNLIIKSLRAFLNCDIIASFENELLKIEIESNENKILYFENYIQKIEKNKNLLLLGINNENKPVTETIYNIKSLLIGGSSGSGKSNLLHNLILSSLLLNQNIYYFMIDLKAVELTQYNYLLKLNRLIKPVATNQKDALNIIILFYSIIKKRYKIMQKNNIRKSLENPIILIIDEYAQLFNNNKDKKIINNLIAKIGAVGRACNCYLFLATQHPTNENLNNTIRANLQSRLGLKAQSPQQSKNIINMLGLEKIKNAGDCIVWIDGKSPQRLKVPFVSDSLLNKIESLNNKK